MRKDHLITNLIGISFFSFIAALVLAIVFAAIRGIIGVVVFLKLTNGLVTHEAFLQKLGHFTTILSHFCKVSFAVSVLLGFAARKIEY